MRVQFGSAPENGRRIPFEGPLAVGLVILSVFFFAVGEVLGAALLAIAAIGMGVGCLRRALGTKTQASHTEGLGEGDR